MRRRLDEVRIAEGLRYRAFLSYRTIDSTLAAWLHRKLEAYRVPRSLVGSTGELGVIPPRIGRIFRDRDEARSESDIETFIAEELAQSQHLVVLCTPQAAAPESWVTREIEIFRKRRPGGRIHAVIGDGAPPECFPAALITRNSDGSVVLPLAADLRPTRRGGHDGKRKAVVKIVAGLIGARFDDLWRREQRRRAVRAAWAAVLAAVIVTGIALSLRTAASMRSVDRYVSLAGTAADAGRWDLAALAAAAAVEHGAWLGPFESAEARRRFGELRDTARTAALLLGHERAITSVVLDDRATTAFSSSLDGRILAWNLRLAGPAAVRPQPLHRIIGGARGLFLTGDRLVAYGGRRVAIIDARNRALLSEVHLADTVRTLGWMRREMAVGLANGTVVLLRGPAFERREVLFQGDSPIEGMAVHGGILLAFGDANGAVYAVDLSRSGAAPRRIVPPSGNPVDHLTFDPTGSFVVVSIDDRAAVVEWHDGSTAAWFTEGESDVALTTLSPSGLYGVSLISGDALVTWRVRDGERAAALQVPGCAPREVFSYACRASVASFASRTATMPERVIAGYWDGTIRIWSVDGALLGTLRGHVARVSALALSHDAQLLLSGSEDHSVRQWVLSSAGQKTTLDEFCQQTDPALLSVSPATLGEPLAFNSQFDKTKVESVALRTRLQEARFRSPCSLGR